MKIRKNIKLPTNPFALCITLLIVVIGVFLRFYNLNWGAPFYFHPDERNIASAISQLSFPQQMNPHFFAYGSLPIYSVFFLGLLQHIQNGAVSFENSIVIGRILSAILSVGVLFLVYRIGLMIGNIQSALIAVCLAALSVGYIQYAHFSTFEMWLSFFTLVLFYFVLLYTRRQSVLLICGIALCIGFLDSVKISSVIFLPVSIAVILGIDFYKKKKKVIFSFLKIFIVILISLATTCTTSPFFILDYSAFKSNITYEGDVAMGKTLVFYTQGFIHSIPIIDPLLKTYPFLINPFIELIFLGLLPYLIYILLKKKSMQLFILLIFLGTTFFSQTFLFVQWSRYYIPTLGFIYILLGYTLDALLSSKKTLNKNIGIGLTIIALLSSVFYSFAYAHTVLFQNDSRIVSKQFAKKKIPSNAFILSELYDLGIVPFNTTYSNIKLLNFYDLDINSQFKKDLSNAIKSSSYIILPSERVINSRNKKDFPVGYAFYSNLSNEKNFKKIYETPCDFYCKILYAHNPWFQLEQTVNVFDRPTVKIYKKI